MIKLTTTESEYALIGTNITFTILHSGRSRKYRTNRISNRNGRQNLFRADIMASRSKKNIGKGHSADEYLLLRPWTTNI